MKKLPLILFIFLIFTSELDAQSFKQSIRKAFTGKGRGRRSGGRGASGIYVNEYGGGIGVANYLGDIGGNEGSRKDFLSDMKLAQTRQALGFYFRHKLKAPLSYRKPIYLKAELNYLRIAGDDKLTTNVFRNARNLNFVNDMLDFNVQTQFVFFEDPDLGADYRFNLGLQFYAGVGIGFFYSEPKTTYKGETVKLRPLKTEGAEYSPFGLSVPFTLGFHFTYKRRHRFGWELMWRKTFTDYLDDISQGWGDPSKMEPLAVELSNRTDELNIPLSLANNYGYDPIDNPKNIRGTQFGETTFGSNSSRYDNYLTMCITYGYIFRGKSGFYRSRYSNYFIKKRRKLKTLRSKF